MNIYQERRARLLERVANSGYFPKNSCILVAAAFDVEETTFIQDPSFWYLTGCQEPGSFLLIESNGTSTLYIPNTGGVRAQWVSEAVAATPKWQKDLGVDAIEHLGSQLNSYMISPFFEVSHVVGLINRLEDIANEGGKIFTPNPQRGLHYLANRFAFDRLAGFSDTIANAVVDCSPDISALRRIKSKREVEMIYDAVEITNEAQFAAAQVIGANGTERAVQAALEYQMIAAGAIPAFGSIVAAGANTTVLHYKKNAETISHGDLVLVDIGARINGYCADITRTYPASGAFTDRQLEIYNAVLTARDYVAQLAMPGMYLRNAQEPDKSLHHLCVKFFEEQGLGEYFKHSVGHYLGLEVHDVGDYGTPLEEGDIITIEPGLYIAKEALGIRIEDDYWITAKGAVCLSEELPADPEVIEQMIESAQQDALL